MEIWQTSAESGKFAREAGGMMQGESRDLIVGMLGEEALDRLHAGSALPNVAYTSREWLELERTRLMWSMWMLAGFESQIPETGDCLPVRVAGCPIVLVRGHDGGVAAFHNVCRHRGAVIVTECRRRLGALTCPYHGWSYGLDGRIRTRPHFHGGGRHDTAPDHSASLAGVRCESWRGMLFVNIDGRAGPLDRHMAPIDDHLAGWQHSALAWGGSLVFDIAANWKHVHENFIDVYHKFAIHPALCAFAPLEASNPMTFIAPHLAMTWHVIARPEEGRGVGLPRFRGLPDALHREGRSFTVIPTCNINLWPDHIAVLVAEPEAPGRTRETIHFLFDPDAMAEACDTVRSRVFETWDALNLEDIGVLESMQRGRVSPGFDGGSLSSFWDPATHMFSSKVVELMMSGNGSVA